jgi:DNA-binding transcriptional ArsR family regulator
MIVDVARAPTTLDAFSAIAEPRRREILAALAQHGGQQDVTTLVDSLGWPQPQVSKHLGVLRKVGLVHVVRHGKRRIYNLNGQQLRLVYEWVRTYERFWDSQLQRIKDRAERAYRQSVSDLPRGSSSTEPATPSAPPRNPRPDK